MRFLHTNVEIDMLSHTNCILLVKVSSYTLLHTTFILILASTAIRDREKSEEKGEKREERGELLVYLPASVTSKVE